MGGNGAWARRGAAAGLALVLSCGCVSEDQGDLTVTGFRIHHASRLSPPDCLVPVGDGASLAEGTLDLSLRDTFAAYLDAHYHWFGYIDPEVHGPGVFVMGVRLRYEADPRVPVWLEPAEEQVPFYLEFYSYGTIRSFLVRPAAAATMRAALAESGLDSMRIRVGIRLFGIRGDDAATVQSPEFVFPITVCSGCLTRCPTGVDLAPYLPGCQCDCTAEVPRLDAPCIPGQEDPVDCRLGLDCGS